MNTKLLGIKSSIQKDVASLVTKSSLKEKLRKQSHLQSQQKRIKCLGNVEQRRSNTCTLNTSRKIFCAHGLEELTLPKFLYYLKQCTNSVKSLSKSQ